MKKASDNLVVEKVRTMIKTRLIIGIVDGKKGGSNVLCKMVCDEYIVRNLSLFSLVEREPLDLLDWPYFLITVVSSFRFLVSFIGFPSVFMYRYCIVMEFIDLSRR